MDDMTRRGRWRRSALVSKRDPEGGWVVVLAGAWSVVRRMDGRMERFGG